MRCAQARRLFSAYWDDETTQAEREWLETHFAGCDRCRHDYEEETRLLETLGSMPRAEAPSDLAERVLARARRATPAPDRVGTPSRTWVPATAAASLVVIAVITVSPWLRMAPPAPAVGPVAIEPVRQPELASGVTPSPQSATDRASGETSLPDVRTEAVAAIPDSIFDHNADVEFILDPVVLRRGRATMTRVTPGVQAEQAVVSF